MNTSNDNDKAVKAYPLLPRSYITDISDFQTLTVIRSWKASMVGHAMQGHDLWMYKIPGLWFIKFSPYQLIVG